MAPMYSIVDIETGISTDTDDRRKQDINIHLSHWAVRMTLTLCIGIMTWSNLIYNDMGIDPFEEYGKIFGSLLVVIVTVPCLSLPMAISNCLGILAFNPYEECLEPPCSLDQVPFICFRIVTRGDYPELVRRNADTNNNLCASIGLQQYVIEVVSDRPIGLAVNKRLLEVVVPRSYETKRKTRFKARALNYCLENHVNKLSRDDWIVHLDEETQLSVPALYGIMKFIKERKGDIGQGPISYVNCKVIQNWLTTLADSVRLAFDYSFFRFQFSVLRKPLFGFKGSYIVLKHGTEADVGLDLGPNGSIAEDCNFALLAWKMGFKFEFVSGEMKENSPITVSDFIKQRRRWFVGQFYTVLNKDIPINYKFFLSISVLSCILMPFGVASIFVGFLFPFKKPLLMRYIMGFLGGSFAFLYAFGVFKSFSDRGFSFMKRICLCVLTCFVIIPVSASLESYATMWGLATLNSKEFFVIKKENMHNQQKKAFRSGYRIM